MPPAPLLAECVTEAGGGAGAVEVLRKKVFHGPWKEHQTEIVKLQKRRRLNQYSQRLSGCRKCLQGPGVAPAEEVTLLAFGVMVVAVECLGKGVPISSCMPSCRAQQNLLRFGHGHSRDDSRSSGCN